MTTETPSTKRPGVSRGVKILIGLAGGCGAIGLMIAVAFFAGMYWLVSPGKQVATERIVSERSLGFIQVTDSAGDRGTQDLLQALLRHVEEAGAAASPDSAPEFLRKYQEMNRRQAAQGLQMYIPKAVTFSMEPVEGQSGGHWVGAANLRSFARAMNWALSSLTDDEGYEYRGHSLRRLGHYGAFLTFYDSTLLVAWDEEPMKATIDRLASGGRSESLPAEAQFPGGEIDPDWDIYGTVHAESENLDILVGILEEWVLDPLATPEMDSVLPGVESIQLARFGIDVLSADSVHLDLTLECASALEAQRWADSLRGQSAPDGETGQLGITLQSTSDRDRVETTVKIVGLDAWLSQFLQGALSSAYDFEE